MWAQMSRGRVSQTLSRCRGDVLERAPELADAVQAAHHERVERDRADEAVAARTGESISSNWSTIRSANSAEL